MLCVLPTRIAGLVLIEHEPFFDERGSFERWWCEPSLQALNLTSDFTQMSLSRNTQAGTLRGMHVAVGEGAETKLIRCIRGAVFDVIADVRPDSPTYGMWEGFVLRADVPRALHVAPGLAHGFLSLEDHSDVLYLIDTPYVPEAARIISYLDTRLNISWPGAVSVISPRDEAAPDLRVFADEFLSSRTCV